MKSTKGLFNVGLTFHIHLHQESSISRVPSAKFTLTLLTCMIAKFFTLIRAKGSTFSLTNSLSIEKFCFPKKLSKQIQYKSSTEELFHRNQWIKSHVHQNQRKKKSRKEQLEKPLRQLPLGGNFMNRPTKKEKEFILLKPLLKRLDLRRKPLTTTSINSDWLNTINLISTSTNLTKLESWEGLSSRLRKNRTTLPVWWLMRMRKKKTPKSSTNILIATLQTMILDEGRILNAPFTHSELIFYQILWIQNVLFQYFKAF